MAPPGGSPTFKGTEDALCKSLPPAYLVRSCHLCGKVAGETGAAWEPPLKPFLPPPERAQPLPGQLHAHALAHAHSREDGLARRRGPRLGCLAPGTQWCSVVAQAACPQGPSPCLTRAHPPAALGLLVGSGASPWGRGGPSPCSPFLHHSESRSPPSSLASNGTPHILCPKSPQKSQQLEDDAGTPTHRDKTSPEDCGRAMP